MYEQPLIGDRLHAQLLNCDWHGLDLIFHAIVNDPYLFKKLPLHVLSATPASPELFSSVVRSIANNKARQIVVVDIPPVQGAKKKITIGYVIENLDDYFISRLLSQIVSCHDNERFNVVIFSAVAQIGEQLFSGQNPGAEKIINTEGLSGQGLVELSRSLDVDIAIYINSEIIGSGDVSVSRIAPIQISMFGSYGTLGSPFIDYILADYTLIDERSASYYQEQVVYLPNLYQPCPYEINNEMLSMSRSDMGLPSNGFVFCSFAIPPAITPDVYDIWVRLLKRVEGSVLLLSVESREAEKNLVSEVIKRGVTSDRLLFIVNDTAVEALANLRIVDLFLDTFYINSHAAVSFALSVNVAVLTRMGSSYTSRTSSSLLDAVGLPDLITYSSEEYEELAYELATNPDRLAYFKERIALRYDLLIKSDLIDYVENLERNYIKLFCRLVNDGSLASRSNFYPHLENDVSTASSMA